MRELLWIVLVPSLLSLGEARAESFGGWRFSAPKGYAAKQDGNHIVYTRSKPTFCTVALFQARPMNDTLEAERETEWHDVIELNFTAVGVRRGSTMQPRAALGVQPTSATLRDAEGNKLAARHYLVTAPGMVGSVLLLSDTRTALARCEPTVRALLRSLELDGAAMIQADPEARVETPVGRWTARTGAVDEPTGGAASDTAGAPADDADDAPAVDAPEGAAAAVQPLPPSSIRTYNFAADGTYRFHGEVKGGALLAGQVQLLDERGTYTVTGNQLTLLPRTAASVLRDQDTVTPGKKVQLEKVTYTWAKLYFAATNTWALVLTPPKKTARDGELSTNPRYATSYVYAEVSAPR